MNAEAARLPAASRASRTGSALPRLYGLMRPYRRTIAAGFACLLLSVAAELFPPLIWLRVVDVGLARRDWNEILWQLGLLIGVLALGQIFSAWRTLLLERAGQRLTLELRMQMFDKLQAQSGAYFANARTGDILTRLTSDVENIQSVLVNGTDAVLGNALRLIGVAGIFIALQPRLGVLTLLPMLAVGLLLTRYNRAVRPSYRAARNRLGEIGARLADALGGMRVIQAFAQEARVSAGLRALGFELYDQQLEAIRLRNRSFPLIRFVSNLSNAIMLGGGVFFIAQGTFTLGGLLAYRGYGRYFFGPIDDLVSINDLVQRAEASGGRIFELLDAPVSVTEPEDAVELGTVRGELTFEGVSFGYEPDHPVLKDISFTVQPGMRVVILGASGVGKSTLLGLVTRDFDPQAGRVLVDGVDLRRVALQPWRAQVAQVLQETFLFSQSVADNIRFARPDATPREIEAAARAANAYDFIRALPQGFETPVGERGVKLSGGQRQRVAIARAVLSDPRVLLLDEPTSAVEPESEALILEGLLRLAERRTTLIVTHRLSLARGADLVVVLHEGRVVEQESPPELVRRGGRYAAMLASDRALERIPV